MADLHPSTEPFRVKTKGLFEFFPDELVIEKKIVTIIKREFLSTNIETIPVREIGEVDLSEAGPFISTTLTIKERTAGREVEIKGLPKEKAEEAERLIEKLIREE